MVVFYTIASFQRDVN